jgi:hypothetical protein
VDQHHSAVRRLLSALDHRARAGAKSARLLEGALQPNDVESRLEQGLSDFLWSR